MNTQKLTKWLRALDRIERDVNQLLLDRDTFREVMKIVESNPQTHQPNHFVQWMALIFAEATAVRVRRLADTHKDTVSLVNLLSDVEVNATMITRKWYIDQYKPDHQRLIKSGLVNKWFDGWAGSGKLHIDVKNINAMKARVVDAATSIRSHVDKTIAHSDPNGQSNVVPTWGDLNRAIDEIEQVTMRIISLLRQEGAITLCPVVQSNWKRVFDIPWRAGKRKIGG